LLVVVVALELLVAVVVLEDFVQQLPQQVAEGV
jgi:hypothetical protein